MKYPDSSSAQVRKVALASFVGTTIEWYDFFLYGTASALVFGRLFFPNFDPLTGTLASFGTYAAGFAARPFGAIVCGHFGDRIGRRSMLVLTLIIMGVATFLIGLLPTYASIGIWAPTLLVVMRLAQGFAVGGEWGGAVLMAVEHSPKGRRGFYGSWPQIGVPAGLLLSTGIFSLLTMLPEEALLSWGWRIAFLLSIFLVVVGLFIRLRVVEPPVFTEIKQKRAEARIPIIETIRQHPRNLLLAMGARFADNAVFYIYTVFILTYATQPQIGFSRSAVLNAVSIAAVIQLVALPAYGWLSDRLGRRPVYMFGAIFTGLFAFPFFQLIESASPLLLVLALVIALIVGHSAMYGPQASFFAELFGTRVRYTGASLGYQLSSVLAGGLSPLIATELLRRTGSSWPIAIYIIGISLITTISVFLASETAHKDIIAEGDNLNTPGAHAKLVSEGIES
ncbi:MAG: MHS family MFS transporter [Acidobacteria bacterium]|nr:MHS family MFS transporter [Acidobacteriota bacterium]